MPVTGSGLGDEIGSPQQMGPRELEATAAVVVNRAALAIVKDSIEISFTQFGGNLWNYMASSSQPTLSHPLETLRTSSASKPAEDTSWKEFFDKLIQDLPAEIAARLIREREKLKEERSISYTGLNDFLMTMAKALSWVESASKPENPNSVAYRNMVLNLALPTIIAENLSSFGKTFLEEAFQYLNHVGPNNIHYDELSNILNQANSTLNYMSSLEGKGK